MSSNIVRFDVVRTALFSAITGSYTPFGSAFTHAMRVLHFINDTNGTFMLSFDGVTDNIPLLASTFSLYDLTSDQDVNESFRYEIGTQLYIKYLVVPTNVVGTTNSVFLTAVYGKGE